MTNSELIIPSLSIALLFQGAALAVQSYRCAKLERKLDEKLNDPSYHIAKLAIERDEFKTLSEKRVGLLRMTENERDELYRRNRRLRDEVTRLTQLSDELTVKLGPDHV